jgi:cytochrome c peroxidase
MRGHSARMVRTAHGFVLVSVGLYLGAIVWAQVVDEPPVPPGSLKQVPVPEPPNLAEFVRDRHAAITLGKALFWDMQVGSDAVQGCATCHFHAGADNRRKNQIGPGLLAGDTTFQVGGPNYTLNPHDFPLTKHADEGTPDSRIVSDSNDVISSQGVFLTQFVDAPAPGSGVDLCEGLADPVFQVNGITVRRIEPRNTPSMFNAVFNFRNFWDGRANHNFNGVNPFGQRDPNAHVWKADSATGTVEPVTVVIPNGSLASQAVGPPLSGFEMSCVGRVFPKVGRKLLAPELVPLARQFVEPTDSVLGPYARGSGTEGSTGLTVSYAELVQRAFRPEWWSHRDLITEGHEQFTQMELNFSLFFGLAVQLYEATLVSDDTRFDRFADGDTSALSPLEQEGLQVFTGVGQCVQCHGAAEFTNASVRNVRNQRPERMIMGDGGCAIYDNGFYNIGVRPTADDLGVGGTDPFGNPLSDTRMAMMGLFFDPDLSPPLGEVPECDSRANVDGAFKTPTLRNAELTGPYFHNGGKATLRQAVEFYNRGGDFSAQNIRQLDPDIQRLDLTPAQQGALVAFLQALTDERVRQEMAPFDHPQLFRPQGHPKDHREVQEERTGTGGTGRAKDDLFEVPPVGAGGRPAAGLVPLQPFLSISQMTGSGRLGDKSDIAHFGFKFRLRDTTSEGQLRFDDKTKKVKVHADTLSDFFTTETCVTMSGPARVNGNHGFSYSAKGCDNRQPGHGRDTLEVTIIDGAGAIVYFRSGVVTGGNLQAHIK